MSEQTITQTQTLADAETDWTNTVGFQQFNPDQGSLQAIDVGITGDVDGSVSIENLGPVTATSDISLLGTMSVIGPGDTLLAAADPVVGAVATLAPYDGTVDFTGPSGTVLAGLQNSATNFSTETVSADPGPFTGTGTVPLTVEAQASVTESGPTNLEMLSNTSAGAVVTLQYDYNAGSSSGSGGGGGVVITSGMPELVWVPDQSVASAIQTFVVPDTITDWAGTIAAQQFDPALGTLEAVSLQLIGDLNSSVAIENLGSVASGFSVDQAASITLDLPGATEAVTASPDPAAGTLTGFDGSVDFTGTSGQMQSGIVSTATLIDNLTDATDLGAFAGTGTIDFGVTGYGTADATVPGNSLLELGGLAGATIEISYLYLPAAVTDDQYETGFSDFGPNQLPVVGTPSMGTVNVDPACFARGTRIATKHGERAIESLAVGDKVALAGGGCASIIWLGRRRVDCRRHPTPRKVWPVRIKAHAFGTGQPRRDLLLSPDHAVYAEGVLIPIKYLVNGTTVRQEQLDRIEYWHLELPHHHIVLAEGLAAESLLDSGRKDAFENGGITVQLYPDFAALQWEASGCAPLKVIGPEVDRVRAKLSKGGLQLASTKTAAMTRSAIERRRLVARDTTRPRRPPDP